jgi:hypothetical protein
VSFPARICRRVANPLGPAIFGTRGLQDPLKNLARPEGFEPQPTAPEARALSAERTSLICTAHSEVNLRTAGEAWAQFMTTVAESAYEVERLTCRLIDVLRAFAGGRGKRV